MKITFNKETGTLEISDAEDFDKYFTVVFTPEETRHLIRQCVTIAHTLDTHSAVGPKVVTVPLYYSDLDNEQDTVAYHWAVMMPDLEIAKAVVEAVDAEIKLAGFGGSRAHIPVVPELAFDTETMMVLPNLAAAIRSLRIALWDHQSDSVWFEVDYWTELGFTEEEYEVLAASFDGYYWMNREEPFSVYGFMKYAREEFFHEPTHPLLTKLSNWISGMPIDQLKESNARENYKS